MTSRKWDARIARAGELASAYPSAAEGLRFYRCIAEFQKSLYRELEDECGKVQVARVPGMLQRELDPFVLMPRFAAFLTLVENTAPAPLAKAAAAHYASGGNSHLEILTSFWRPTPEANLGSEPSSNLDPSQALLAWMFLQPYAEYLADYSVSPPLHATPPVCPRCSSKPLAGVLRPEGDGGKRSLICSLCATEWEFRRIVCPGCGEENVHKLAVYTANEIPHVRVEACETCHQYIKTVDLTKDGHALAAVDELATIPLNLWAAEHGYTKIQPNLLGI